MDNGEAISQFLGRLERTTTALAKAEPVALEKAALRAKRALLDVPGAPRFLKGVGRRGAKVGVRYKMLGQRAASVRWVGPAHLVNNPTAAHRIPKERGARSRKAVKPVVVDGQPYAHVTRPATKGKHFYEIGREIALKEIPNVHRQVIHDALREIYKGD